MDNNHLANKNTLDEEISQCVRYDVAPHRIGDSGNRIWLILANPNKDGWYEIKNGLFYVPDDYQRGWWIKYDDLSTDAQTVVYQEFSRAELIKILDDVARKRVGWRS